MEAIATQRVVTASYNGAPIRLAPHLIFSRHGDLFVSALNTAKKWRSEDERRLGHFKLLGLHSLVLLEEKFEPLPLQPLAPPRSDDLVIFSV